MKKIEGLIICRFKKNIMTNEMDWLPEYRVPRKAKVKKQPIAYRYDMKSLYYDARRVMFKRELPQAWAAGLYHDNAYPAIDTTNGATRYIRDVINNLGHNADRVNTQGTPVKDERTGQINWRYSGSTKGSSDVHCEIVVPWQMVPVPWKIELKRGRDSLSKAQTKYQAKMLKIGAFHSVVYVEDLSFFWDEYYKIINHE